MYAYTDTCMHVTIINGKGGHGFGREQRGLYGRIWREENEKGNYMIVL